MGRYDKEIIGTMHKFLPASEPQKSIEALARDLFNSYSLMKSMLLKEVFVPDLLRKLDSIISSNNFNDMRSLLEQLIFELQGQLYDNNDIISLASNIAGDCISLLQILYNKTLEEIITATVKIYQNKNSFYGDVWYNRLETGICLDMGRKIIRLDHLLKKSNFENQVREESFYDTILDLINYCCLMIVFVKYIN